VVFRIDAQVFCKVCPATSNADHDAIAILSHASYEELDGFISSRLDKVVQPNVGVISIPPRFLLVGWSKRQEWDVLR
jgi:hypothetical protein